MVENRFGSTGLGYRPTSAKLLLFCVLWHTSCLVKNWCLNHFKLCMCLISGNRPTRRGLCPMCPIESNESSCIWVFGRSSLLAEKIWKPWLSGCRDCSDHGVRIQIPFGANYGSVKRHHSVIPREIQKYGILCGRCLYQSPLQLPSCRQSKCIPSDCGHRNNPI